MKSQKKIGSRVNITISKEKKLSDLVLDSFLWVDAAFYGGANHALHYFGAEFTSVWIGNGFTFGYHFVESCDGFVVAFMFLGSKCFQAISGEFAIGNLKLEQK